MTRTLPKNEDDNNNDFKEMVNVHQATDEDVLGILGNIGKYQIQIYLLSCLPTFIAGALSISFVFTTSLPQYRCFVDGCDQSEQNNRLFDDKFLMFTTPYQNDSKSIDSCHTFSLLPPTHLLNRNQTVCSSQKFDNQSQSVCNKYVFDDQYLTSSIATDFKLYCGDAWIVQLLQSLFFLGILIGALVNGILADKYGRQIIFRIYSFATSAVILTAIFSSDSLIYGLSLLLKGVCVSALYQSSFVIGIEGLGGGWRFWLGNILSIFFALGGVYSCFIAYLFRTWIKIEYSNLALAILILPYPFLMPESLRWLITNGPTEKAIKQISSAARKNKISTSDEFLITVHQLKNSEPTKRLKSKPVFLTDLFTHPVIRTWTIILLYVWFTNALVYYGLAFLASDIHPNIYFSMALLMLVEIPAIFLTAYTGEFTRKYVLMISMVLGGAACIISSFLNGGLWKMWLAILGKLTISGSFSLIYVYAAEIFPTVLRTSGIGMCSMFARFGAMSAPYLLRLQYFGKSFPFLIVGTISFLAGLLSYYLPETKGKKLPDSLEEVEQLKHDNYIEIKGNSNYIELRGNNQSHN